MGIRWGSLNDVGNMGDMTSSLVSDGKICAWCHCSNVAMCFWLASARASDVF